MNFKRLILFCKFVCIEHLAKLNNLLVIKFIKYTFDHNNIIT